MSFKLRKLRLSGKSVINAEVVFCDGLNVISGPSNTGKTYIFQCINWMLGSKNPPKSITQAKGYSNVFLEIETPTGERVTIESALNGGNFKLYNCETEKIGENESNFRILSRKHSSVSDDNISTFLLGLNNLSKVQIRTNAKGAKSDVSYRDVAKFLLIDESNIITDKSPILSDNYITATKEKSLLKFILTGNDDSEIIEILTKDQITSRRGKLELLEQLINDTNKNVSVRDEKVELDLSTINKNIEKLSTEHIKLKDRFLELDKIRKRLLNEINEKSNQKLYFEELLKRSNILKQQYLSDVNRLNSTIEASSLLAGDHTYDSFCPLCKSVLHEKCSDDDILQIIQSCELEISKIIVLNDELFKSKTTIDLEISNLDNEIGITKRKFDSINYELNYDLNSKMSDIITYLNDLNSRKTAFFKDFYIKENLNILIRQKQILENSSTQESGSYDEITTSSTYELSEAMRNVLMGCRYPNLSSVSFSEDKTDFVISGEDRELSGKGYRAITYSAFIIALQELVHNKPYSLGTPVLDSPLVTYRPNEESGSESIPINLAMDFYRYVARSEKINQLIILENEEPPEDILNVIHHIKFTQSVNDGRYGFFPLVTVE